MAVAAVEAQQRPLAVGNDLRHEVLTGTQIVVNRCCGTARSGVGAFPGKDPARVDRALAYTLRWTGAGNRARSPQV